MMKGAEMGGGPASIDRFCGVARVRWPNREQGLVRVDDGRIVLIGLGGMDWLMAGCLMAVDELDTS